MKKSILLLLVLAAVGSLSWSGEKGADRGLDIEVKRVEEAFRLLDRFAEKIWPGWDNYKDIEFKVTFPNKVRLLMNPHGAAPAGYQKYAGRTLNGKPVWVDRTEQTPQTPVLPLVVGRGRGGRTIQIQLRQLKLPPPDAEKYRLIEEKIIARAKEDTPFDIAPQGDSDGYILMCVHECFHGFQSKIGLERWGNGALAKFDLTPEYAAGSSVEGLALKDAFYLDDAAAALEAFKDYVVARETKQESMPRDAGLNEAYISIVEGTATYTSLKMAMLLRDTAYQPGVSRKDDPFFYGFRHADAYVDSLLKNGLRFVTNLTFDKRGKYYLYGAYQCLVLDRFAPGWKRGFLSKKVSLDKTMADFLNLSPEEKMRIARRLKSKYGYSDFHAKHAAAIKKSKQQK